MAGRHARYAKGRGRKRAGEMNRLEAAYALELDRQLKAGEILMWKFESIKLRLADRTWYNPDFLVMTPDGELQLHETKGFMEDDANVKLKVTAETFPLRLLLVRARAKKDGGGFIITEV